MRLIKQDIANIIIMLLLIILLVCLTTLYDRKLNSSTITNICYPPCAINEICNEELVLCQTQTEYDHYRYNDTLCHDHDHN